MDVEHATEAVSYSKKKWAVRAHWGSIMVPEVVQHDKQIPQWNTPSQCSLGQTEIPLGIFLNDRRDRTIRKTQAEVQNPVGHVYIAFDQGKNELVFCDEPFRVEVARSAAIDQSAEIGGPHICPIP